MRLKLFLAVALVIAGACDADTFTGDAGGSDTGPDVPAIGGGDGGSADGAIVEAGPKRFCDTVDAQFCADFDIPGDAGAGFEAPTENGGWTLDFQDAQVKSTPVAVEIDTIGDAGGVASMRTLPLSPDASVKSVLVAEADLFLPDAAPATPDVIMVFAAGSLPAQQFLFGLAEQSGLWSLAHITSLVTKPLNPKPATNEWVHAIVSVDMSVSGTVTLEVDSSVGKSFAALSVATIPDGGAPGYLGVIQVGSSDGYDSVANRTFFVDNVTANWQ
ncbi:MAG TPA: hypothetical protein VGH28_06630 [Polyangiaceae bacterium]|jgi:hypothetical protein